MEISTTTSHATSEAKVTSHYWGYRELTADEVSAVAGGYDGNGGPGSDSPDSNNSGGTAGNSTGGGGSLASAVGSGMGAIAAAGALATATGPAGAAIAGIAAVGAAISNVGNQPTGPKSEPVGGNGGYDQLGNQTGTGILNYYYNDGDHGSN